MKEVIFMSYIKEIFERQDLYSVCQFLKTGDELIKKDERPYMERLKSTEQTALKALRTLVTNEKESEDLFNKIIDYACACEDVYLEIGVRCGFLLALQVLGYKQVDGL